MVNNILEHLTANVYYYKVFYTGDLILDVERYSKFGKYVHSIIHVIIIATAKALHVNLSIYQKGPDGNLNVIEQTTNKRGKEVLWMFM